MPITHMDELVLTDHTTDYLHRIITSARAELSRRVTSDDPFKAIRGQEHCKRALVVAAIQGHTVAVYGPHGSGKTMLVQAGHALGVPVLEGTPCPCGNYTSPQLACKCDVAAIEEHWSTTALALRRCDIHVECPAVPARELLSDRPAPPTSWAKEQVASAGPLPDKEKLDDLCNRALRQAITELGMSAAVVDVCLSVARSIAALSGHDALAVDDVLEAIHYRPLDRVL